jgi:hypothetical protein
MAKQGKNKQSKNKQSKKESVARKRGSGGKTKRATTKTLKKPSVAKSIRRAKPRRTTTPRTIARKTAAAWQPTPEAQKVIDTTQDVFDNTAGAAGDCNKFVKAVCDKLTTNPFADSDNADDITNDIRSGTWLAANGWTGLKEDPVAAKTAADRGDLVIGGATAADLSQNHGHVVVVVSCEKLWKGYGYASWGRLGGTGNVNEKMTVAYKLTDLPKVSYMSKSLS